MWGTLYLSHRGNREDTMIIAFAVGFAIGLTIGLVRYVVKHREN